MIILNKKRYWDEDYGDRRQQIVFIGIKSETDEKAIRNILDDCLVTDYLLNTSNYFKMPDPFPGWFK